MKYLLLALLLVLFFALIAPRRLTSWLRAAGRALGGAGRAGAELLTGDEVERSPLARYEARAGEIVAARLLADRPPLAHPELQRRVAEVGRRLAGEALRRQIPYRFQLVAGNDANAFAVAGGSIFITRPLVELCGGDDDLLAGVLAHEVVHIDRRHAVRQLAATAAVRGGLRILSLGRAALIPRLASGMEKLLVQGYRQDQELEADLLGSRLAALAGFDAHGLRRLLERLASTEPEAEGALAAALGYFRSHPPLRERIASLPPRAG